jgi:signal transduction histidine kinase/streptogramin lyase
MFISTILRWILSASAKFLIVESAEDHFDSAATMSTHSRRSVCCLVLLILASACGHSIGASASEYVSQTWGVDEGLPHNTINRVLQDQQGYLWLATLGGLARFDGLKFEVFVPPEARAQANYSIRGLVEESPGSLVVLPATGGIDRFRDKAFSVHPASVMLAGKRPLNLFAEPGGALWIVTGSHEVSRWDNGQIVTFNTTNELPGQGGRFSFAIDGHKNVWIATGDFLGSYHDGHLQQFPQPVGSDLIIAASRSDGIWISSRDRLLRMEEGQVTSIRTMPDWSSVTQNSVEQIFEDQQNCLWIATHLKGLFKLHDGSITPQATGADEITSIIQDVEENIWVATNGAGLCRLRPKTFLSLNTEQGLTSSVSTSLCEDSLGSLWAANRNGGLYQYSNGKLSHYGTADGSPLYMNVVCPGRDGKIWAAANEGIFTISVASPTYLQKVVPAPNNVRALFCAANGDLWAGFGETGIGYFHNGAFRDCTALEGRLPKRVRAIAEDGRENIWIADGEKNISQFDNDRFIPRYSKGQVPGGILNAFLITKAGPFLVGTTDGLILIDGNHIVRLGAEEGLADETVAQLLQDDGGRIWCGGRRGFSVISMAEVADVIQGSRKHLNVITLGKAEGIVGASALNGEEPMAWIGKGNRLWFTTQGGVVGIDSTASPGPRLAPPVYVDAVFMDGRLMDLAANLTIPPGDHTLDFKFTALNFAAPAKVNMRHELAGFDSGWIETGSDRSATYAHLTPGNYRLDVTAANEDGRWNDAGASLTVTVVPAWWQTWWFRSFCGVGVAAIFLGLGRAWSHWRLQQRYAQMEQENRLEKERTRIARDLHDELGASVTRIGMMAERLKRNASSEVLKDEMSKLASHTRRLSGELEGVIWTVSPKNGTWDRLASFIRQFSLNFFADTSISCTVEGVESAPVRAVSPDVQHHILAILKESLTNILKHAEASRVEITMWFEHDELRLWITDNGHGFDITAKEHLDRNGLGNQRIRAREIGATLEITSDLIQGTEIKLTFPFERDVQSKMLSTS